ncbi:hypothetical protein I4U23_031207 [Adineta vaga]|nr:hypothetical protein I4U23_031207 [Adineta vaga]
MGEQQLRYKFRRNERHDLLENYIRRELNVPDNLMMSFVDLKDNTVVSVSLLSDLESESHIDIILKLLDRSKASISQREGTNDTSLSDAGDNNLVIPNRAIDSFSDTNKKMVLVELSSPSSSTSESDHKSARSSLIIQALSITRTA